MYIYAYNIFSSFSPLRLAPSTPPMCPLIPQIQNLFFIYCNTYTHTCVYWLHFMST